MLASLATIPRPQGISSDAVCVSFSPSAFTFDTEPHNQLCNLASFDATLTPRTNSHTREMYSQRFVGLMCAEFLRNRGCRRQRRARVEQRPKAQPRRCRFAALAVPACGAHAHRSLRRIVPHGSLWGGIRAFLFLSWRVSRPATGARLGHARSHARTQESETSRAPPQVLAHGHTCSRKSGEALSSLGQHTCQHRARTVIVQREMGT